MQDLENIETSLLVEMLAIYTIEYTNMLSNNIKGQAFDDCEFNMSRLQAAINARQKGMNDTKNTQSSNTVEHVPQK